jgi:hypothetical protein
LIGRPILLASSSAKASSGYTWSFEPNPPPTRGAMILSLDSGIPVAIAIAVRRMWGICVDVHIVNWLDAALGSTRIDRGSIAFATRRCTRYRSLTTTGASANTFSTSPFVSFQL